LLFLPVLGYAQETGLEFGATGMYNFYTDRSDTSIYTSSINSVISFTTEKQINLKLESDVWTTGNAYHYIAALRYKKFPFNFYGLAIRRVPPIRRRSLKISSNSIWKPRRNYYRA